MKIETSKQSKKTFNFLFLNSINNKRVYSILLLSFFLTAKSFSQSFSNQIIPNISIVQVDAYLGTLKTLSQPSNSASAYNKLESLLKDVQPSIYLTKGLIKTYGQNPVCIYSDVASLKLLNNNLPLIDDVEILTIKIESPSDFKNQLDICSVTNLKKLKYIYLQISFDYKPSLLSQFIKNCKEGIIILYKIDKGA